MTAYCPGAPVELLKHTSPDTVPPGASSPALSSVSLPPRVVPRAAPCGSCNFQSNPPLNDAASSPLLTIVTALHSTAVVPSIWPSTSGVAVVTRSSRVIDWPASATVSPSRWPWKVGPAGASVPPPAAGSPLTEPPDTGALLTVESRTAQPPKRKTSRARKTHGRSCRLCFGGSPPYGDAPGGVQPGGGPYCPACPCGGCCQPRGGWPCCHPCGGCCQPPAWP